YTALYSTMDRYDACQTWLGGNRQRASGRLAHLAAKPSHGLHQCPPRADAGRITTGGGLPHRGIYKVVATLAPIARCWRASCQGTNASGKPCHHSAQPPG